MSCGVEAIVFGDLGLGHEIFASGLGLTFLVLVRS